MVNTIWYIWDPICISNCVTGACGIGNQLDTQIYGDTGKYHDAMLCVTLWRWISLDISSSTEFVVAVWCFHWFWRKMEHLWKVNKQQKRFSILVETTGGHLSSTISGLDSFLSQGICVPYYHQLDIPMPNVWKEDSGESGWFKVSVRWGCYICMYLNICCYI